MNLPWLLETGNETMCEENPVFYPTNHPKHPWTMTFLDVCMTARDGALQKVTLAR